MVGKISNSYKLTEQQLVIINLLAKGHSLQQIANKLVISKSTVASHVAAVATKLNTFDMFGANRQTKIVIACLKLGIIKLEDLDIVESE